MKRAIICAAIAMSGCEVPPEQAEADIRARAELVRNCPGGLLIGRDAVSGRLTWSNGWMGGLVARGVSLKDVCVTMEGANR